MTTYKRIAQLKTPESFRDYIASLGIDLPFDEEIQTGSDAPLAQIYTLKDGFVIGNRFCTHPMEGLGWHPGWQTDRLGHPTLAEFWSKWCEIDLGWRGGCCCP